MDRKEREKEMEEVYKNDILPKCEEYKKELETKGWKMILASDKFSVRLDAFEKVPPYDIYTSKAHVWFFTFPDADTAEGIVNVINIQRQIKDTMFFGEASIALQRLFDDKKDGMEVVESYLKTFREDLLKT